TYHLFVSQNDAAKIAHRWSTFEAVVDINCATDDRDADAIPIVGNPRDDAGEEAPIGGDSGSSVFCGGRRLACLAPDRSAATTFCYRSEAQRVKAKLRACAHRENITNNSANAGGGALEWFNCARMIV